MAKYLYPVITRNELHGKTLGQGGLRDFIETMLLDVNKWEDDFQGDTLHGGYQSTASGVGSAAAALVAGQNGGFVRLTTGTDDNGRSDLSLGLHYRGDQSALMVARVKTDVVTSYKMEVGFTDVISGTDAGAVNNADTPTFFADDFTGFVRDSDFFSGNLGARLMGVAATVAAVSVNSAVTPTAAAYETYIVALQDGVVFGYILNASHEVIYRGTGLAAAVTKTVLLTPWIFAQTRVVSASKNMDIDFLRCYQYIYT